MLARYVLTAHHRDFTPHSVTTLRPKRVGCYTLKVTKLIIQANHIVNSLGTSIPDIIQEVAGVTMKPVVPAVPRAL